MSSPSDADPKGPTRRAMLAGATAVIGATLIGVEAKWYYSQPKVQVKTASVPGYDEADLVDTLTRGLADFPNTLARVKGARVVLKPNMVEFDPTRPINTHPTVVGAAVEAFLFHGAKEVVVAEGPGHRRDTEALVEQSGLADVLKRVGANFVDLNADVPHLLTLPTNRTNLGQLPVARTVLGADLFVSVAKLKTHHFAGATLTMKNLFGTVPGRAVGWPKNPLHFAGIPNSIFDLWDAIRPAFGIIDGVVGMEGDGPLRGHPVEMGVVVMGEQHSPAVDATAARLMGIDPASLEYLTPVVGAGGTIAASRIEQIGENFGVRPFALPVALGSMRAVQYLGS